MSNKPFDKLNPLDQQIRKNIPIPGWTPELTHLEIRYISGFEYFNSRPYHNYETWGSGYWVSDGKIQVGAEDLDDALNLFFEARENPKPWHRVRDNGWPQLPAIFHKVWEEQRNDAEGSS